MARKYIPDFNNLLIKRIENEKKDDVSVGEVVAVGPGYLHLTGKLIVPRYFVGDKVLFDAAVSHEYIFEGEKFFIIPDDRILCKVVEDDTNYCQEKDDTDLCQKEKS